MRDTGSGGWNGGDEDDVYYLRYPAGMQNKSWEFFTTQLKLCRFHLSGCPDPSSPVGVSRLIQDRFSYF